MEIIHSSDVIHKEKPNGTRVGYYLQKEYEIHYNEIPPKTSQEWHSHKHVEEIILILDGQLNVRWVENNVKKEQVVNKGDLVRVENSLHTFVNTSTKEALFVVFKTILSGKDNSKIFKDDKISVSEMNE
jgi:quercetin dioxygenase-like cupin family protein